MSEESLLSQRYKIISQIGAGGMAIVLKAQDLSLGRTVAVKVLRESYTGDTELLHRFLQEARAAANLTHPSIVTVHDFGEDAGRYFMVMEYIEGPNLKTLIRDGGPFTLDRALDYATQICAAVGYAHRAGVAHCDLKPQNILVASDGRLKVTDFGIARVLAAIKPGEKNDVVWGSPQYFSPEQAAGEAPTPASDVYAIGIMLFEMLTNRLPFQSDNPQTLALMHLREDPPPLSMYNAAIPDAMERIVSKVLAKEPSARYRTADQLGHILQSYRERGGDITAGRPAAASRPAAPVAASAPTVAAPALTQPRSRPAPEPAPEEAYYGEEEDIETGFDWLALVLGAVALVAVLGLIPLWLFVLLQYNPGLLR
ncbi:MAG: serine/threonine protein kinase [Chloroflexi bacterium]|nr:serine/threonine protein kinase [Chloroflexota bacterium]